MVAKLPQSLAGAMAENESVDAILTEARAASDLGDLRLVVLSSGRPLEDQELPPGVSKNLAREMDDVHKVLQRELVALSTRADQRVIGDAGHYIHHDRPDVVVDAITEVVEAVRSDVSR